MESYDGTDRELESALIPPDIPRQREQWRAHLAIECVANLDDRVRASYTRRATGLPAMIQRLRLAGTIAFLLSKDPPDQQLANDLAQWLLDPRSGLEWPEAAFKANADKHLNAAETLEALIGHPSSSLFTYRLASREAQLYAVWLKRWSSVAGGNGDTVGSSQDHGYGS